MTELFSDGFESGNFDEWTSNNTTDTFTVDTNNPHHGTYDAEFSIASGATKYARCRKTIASNPIVYMRGYYYFDSFSTITAPHHIGLISIGSYPNVATAIIVKSDATNYWGVEVWETSQTKYVSAVEPTTEKWYCVELLRDVTNNIVTLWIDDVEVISESKAQTVNTTNVDGAISWITYGAAVGQCDCVVVADAYIGCEAEGGQQLFTLINMMEY